MSNFEKKINKILKPEGLRVAKSDESGWFYYVFVPEDDNPLKGEILNIWVTDL